MMGLLNNKAAQAQSAKNLAVELLNGARVSSPAAGAKAGG